MSQDLIHMTRFSEGSALEEEFESSSEAADGSKDNHVIGNEPEFNDLQSEFNEKEGMDFEQIIELSNTITALPDAGLPTKDLLNNLESNLIRTALDQTDGNVSKASDLLQMGRTSLIQKINKYQLGKD